MPYWCSLVVRVAIFQRNPPPPKKMYNPESCDELTGVGDGEAVGRLDVVHVRHQVERGFRGIRAGVVQEDCQTKGGVLLISVSDEQTA